MSELKEIKFDFIRYANCWEDADLLLEGLKIEEGEKVLSICSGGDNSFSLLTRSPELVIAIDVNPVQLFLAKLKKEAIRELAYEDYLAFAGFRESHERKKVYKILRSGLDDETRAYWDQHEKGIITGIAHYGKFERYFRIFAKRVLIFIHTKKRIEELFREKSKEEQEKFYNEKWNTWRWRLLFKIFFSRIVMGRLGRDPKFMNEVKVPVGTYIFNKAETHLKSVHAQKNFMLRYQLTGHFGDLLPHYLQKDNYLLLQKNIDRIVFKLGYAEEAVKEFGTVDAMNLSDIFEYLSDETFSILSHQLHKNLNPGGRVAYWNLMVPRNAALSFPGLFSDESIRLNGSSKMDKGFFYKEFIVSKKI
jgi:S-adenosylmethionine-diacylglycerol 3-amino-3-carboxypropyl transferase